jgi:hypothetical protein
LIIGETEIRKMHVMRRLARVAAAAEARSKRPTAAVD